MGRVLAPSRRFGLGPMTGLLGAGRLKLGAGVNPSSPAEPVVTTGRNELKGVVGAGAGEVGKDGDVGILDQS